MGLAGRRFLALDLTRAVPPRADLVICRDLLIHLSARHARAVLANLKASGATWLLTTHFPELRENAEIVTGSFRPVNLCLPPFGLPPPREVVPERRAATGPAAVLGLWRLADLPLG